MPERLPVTRLAPDEDLKARFVSEAERVRAHVHCVPDAQAALATLRALLTTLQAQRAVVWDEAHLPVRGVVALLDALGIARVEGTTTPSQQPMWASQGPTQPWRRQYPCAGLRTRAPAHGVLACASAHRFAHRGPHRAAP